MTLKNTLKDLHISQEMLIFAEDLFGLRCHGQAALRFSENLWNMNHFIRSQFVESFSKIVEHPKLGLESFTTFPYGCSFSEIADNDPYVLHHTFVLKIKWLCLCQIQRNIRICRLTFTTIWWSLVELQRKPAVI